MTSHLLVVLGAAILSVALRSFRNPLLFRLGTICVVVTSFLAGWLLAGYLVAGVIFAATWLFLPWVEILTRIRRLRLPVERTLESRTPPPKSTFPGFSEITEEIEAEGFEYIEDTGWDHEENRQFYRLFYNSHTRTQASICLVEQSEFAFYYLTLTTRTADGRVYATWNYPFSYGLELLPSLRLNRVTGDLPFAEIAGRHEKFLAKLRIEGGDIATRTPAEIRAELQNDLQAQLLHNIEKGLLKRDGAAMIRYSIRGMFYLWMQFLRDLVRMS